MLLGGGRRRAGADEGRIDIALAKRDEIARLVDESRTARPAVGNHVESDGACDLASPGSRSSR